MRSQSSLGLFLFSILGTACAAGSGDARTSDGGDALDESSSDGGEETTAPVTTEPAATEPSTTTDPTDAESTDDESTGEPETTGEEESTGIDDASTGDIDMTTGEAPVDLDDGDSLTVPAVLLQFRATADAPVDIVGPLFNDDALDVRGARYSDLIDPATDPTDHLRFSIVPGETDPYVRLTIECDDPAVRADIVDADEAVVGFATCGAGEAAILLVGAGSTDIYDVVVRSGVDDFVTTDYAVALNAFCFGGCNYQPIEG